MILISTFVVIGCRLVVGLLQAQNPATGQVAARSLEFEVATVKLSSPASRGTRVMIQPGGGFQVGNMTLKNMIQMAYDVRDFQIVGGPGWISSERFDIEAKIGESRPLVVTVMNVNQREVLQQQLNERWRSLLTERFHLVVREEQREQSVYALVLGKNGPRLKVAADPVGLVGIATGRGFAKGTSAPIKSLIDVLAGNVGKPVIDKTGLNGKYDWKLEWTSDPLESVSPSPSKDSPVAPVPSDVSGPSIFTALQEQLGLRLESQKAPALVIVVESASRPTAN